jgi:hypothetical protein
MKKTIITFVLTILLSTSMANAQAFDGTGDFKWIISGSIQSNGTGMEFSVDKGILDFLSTGFKLGYIVSDKTNYEDNYSSEDIFFERILLQYQINAHFGELLRMNENTDIYIGLNIGKNLGSQLGARYMLGESFGFNIELNAPLITNIFMDELNKSDNYEIIHPQIGVVFNF